MLVCIYMSAFTDALTFSPYANCNFFFSYRDAEKNFHNISNRCSYADHSNKEEVEDVSGILQCTANILGISTIYLYG